MRKVIIGVMGGESATDEVYKEAYDLGYLIAEKGYFLLNGGGGGVMEASAKGAKEAGGTTIGVLPSKNKEDANEYIDIAIVTGMSEARNTINILSSDVIIAFPGRAGTLSEIALALNAFTTVVLLNCWHLLSNDFVDEYESKKLLFKANSPLEAIKIIEEIINSQII